MPIRRRTTSGLAEVANREHTEPLLCGGICQFVHVTDKRRMAKKTPPIATHRLKAESFRWQGDSALHTASRIGSYSTRETWSWLGNVIPTLGETCRRDHIPHDQHDELESLHEVLMVSTSPHRSVASVMVTWHHHLGKASKLVVDFRTGDHRAHDKLRDTNRHKSIDTTQYSVGCPPGSVGLERHAWINAPDQCGDLSADILVAKVERHYRPIVILWDNALVLLRRLTNGTHRLPSFLWRLVRAQETIP